MASGTIPDALRKFWTRLQGIATGGTQGQVLTKQSGDDFDADWGDPAAGGGGLDANAVDARIASPDTSATTTRQGGVLIPSALNISDGTSSPFADAVRMFIDDHIEFTGPWSNNGPYRSGNVAEENNRLFQCMEDHDASDPFSSTPSPIASLSLNQGQVGYRRWVDITARDFATNPVQTAEVGDAQITAAKLASGVIPDDFASATFPAPQQIGTLNGTGGAVLANSDANAAIYNLSVSWQTGDAIYFTLQPETAGEAEAATQLFFCDDLRRQMAATQIEAAAVTDIRAANAMTRAYGRGENVGALAFMVRITDDNTRLLVGTPGAASGRGGYTIAGCKILRLGGLRGEPGPAGVNGIISSITDERISGNVFQRSENLIPGYSAGAAETILDESLENFEFIEVVASMSNPVIDSRKAHLLFPARDIEDGFEVQVAETEQGIIRNGLNLSSIFTLFTFFEIYGYNRRVPAA